MPSDSAWPALCILDEAVHRASKGPVSGDQRIIDALAQLRALDVPYDTLKAFWREIGRVAYGDSSEPMANYQRTTNAHLHLIGIARGCGFDLRKHEVCEAMRKAWAG